jgi:hypothetical protein
MIQLPAEPADLLCGHKRLSEQFNSYRSQDLSRGLKGSVDVSQCVRRADVVALQCRW